MVAVLVVEEEVLVARYQPRGVWAALEVNSQTQGPGAGREDLRDAAGV